MVTKKTIVLKPFGSIKVSGPGPATAEAVRTALAKAKVEAKPGSVKRSKTKK